jgi:hypothetical protein
MSKQDDTPFFCIDEPYRAMYTEKQIVQNI